MEPPIRRSYNSQSRLRAAAHNRDVIVEAARELFSRDGFDAVTIDAVAARAGVSAASVYAQFKSKAGLLRVILRAAMFSARYQAAAARLDETSSPVEQLRLCAGVARATWETETRELGLLRGASAVSADLRQLEQAFEAERYDALAPRIARLAEAGLLAVPVEEARRVLWMYTGRDVYRMMVTEGAWSPERFEAWLADTLVATLTLNR